MIELQKVEKVYRRGAEEVHALREIDLGIGKAEFVAIVGPSGAGKSSLLHILGCLDTPTSGMIRIDGLEIGPRDEARLVEVRRRKIGFIFQQFYLIPGLTVAENIMLPAALNRRRIERSEVVRLADMVGLGHRIDHRPNQLSGGEMQRVAVARALVNEPELLLADEPTGNLDTENSEKIFALLKDLHGRGYTIVMVTHNSELASRCGRAVRLKDGRIVQ